MTCRHRTFRLVLSILIAVGLFGAGLAHASGWSRWLGPNHDGKAQAEGLFPDEGFGLDVVWNRPLGIGYSGIAVQDGVAVTMFADGETDWLTVVEAKTGKELWRYEIDEMYAGHDGSEGGPVGMPVIDDGVVYGLGPKGHLFAVRLEDGKEIWSVRIDEEFGARAPFYGFTSTPLLVDDLLFLQTGGTEGRSLVGLNKLDGKVRWSLGDDPVGYQSPILVEVGGEEQILAVTNARILGLDPKSGDVLWSHELEQAGGRGDGYATPVMLGAASFLLTGNDETKAYRLHGEATRVPEVIWTSRHLKGSLATPVLHEGHLYGFDGDFLTCVDPENGERVWKSRPPGGRGLILVDGHLVVFANDGSVVAIQASPDGYVEKARTEVSEAGTYTYPSYDDGLFFVRNTTDFAAVTVGPPPVETAKAERPEPRNDFERFVRELEQAEDGRLLLADFMNGQAGFPVVENDRWVHFLYRGDVEDVAITGSMNEYQVEVPLTKIEGTDLYYISYPIEPGARFEYRFNVDFENLQPDPMNPRRVSTSEGDFSEVLTSGYRFPGYLHAYRGDNPGRLESLTVTSEILEGERTVDVYLPAGYEDGAESYPLLVVVDGKGWLEEAQFVNTLDQRIGRRVEPLIVAFVRQPEGTGRAELGGDKTADLVRMLTEELVPKIDGEYRTRSEPEARAIAGITNAALVATWAAVERPDLFGRAAGISYYLPSPDAGGLMDVIAGAGESEKASFWIAWSLYELRREEWGVDFARDSRKIVEALESAGFDVSAEEKLDSSGWGGWRVRTGEMLEELFPRSR